MDVHNTCTCGLVVKEVQTQKYTLLPELVPVQVELSKSLTIFLIPFLLVANSLYKLFATSLPNMKRNGTRRKTETCSIN